MAKTILKCTSCGTYTMRDICSRCNLKTKDTKPPRYSPQDKYGKYRRVSKKQTELKA